MTITENPYQSTLNASEDSIVGSDRGSATVRFTKPRGRPVSIDIQTAATFFAVAVPASLVAYCIIRWLSYMIPSPNVLLGLANAAATILGCVAAWRTWDRLTKFHLLRTQLLRDHELAMAEYSQRNSTGANKT